MGVLIILGILGVLQFVLLVLKANRKLQASMWIVLIPLWIALAFTAYIFHIFSTVF